MGLRTSLNRGIEPPGKPIAVGTIRETADEEGCGRRPNPKNWPRKPNESPKDADGKVLCWYVVPLRSAWFAADRAERREKVRTTLRLKVLLNVRIGTGKTQCQSKKFALMAELGIRDRLRIYWE